MPDTKNNEITAEQLVEVLKFTPRTYTVSMWGYGGERVMGTVDRKAWDYCVANRVDLQDIAWDSDAAEELGLDTDMLPFPPGSWYECDDMGHINGVSRDAGTLQILDENNETVFERSLESCDGCDGSPELYCSDEVWIGSRKKGEIVFVGSSNEKGTFFEGEIELTAPFDIEKLQLHYDEFDGEDIVGGISYDGEDIDNNGYGTDGKSSDFNMVMLTNDEGNFVRYDANEPVDVPASVCASETELTEWFPNSVKPVRIGRYEAHINIKPVWPWPAVTMLEWTGKNWKDADGDVIKNVVEWRGVLGPTE